METLRGYGFNPRSETEAFELLARGSEIAIEHGRTIPYEEDFDELKRRIHDSTYLGDYFLEDLASAQSPSGVDEPPNLESTKVTTAHHPPNPVLVNVVPGRWVCSKCNGPAHSPRILDGKIICESESEYSHAKVLYGASEDRVCEVCSTLAQTRVLECGHLLCEECHSKIEPADNSSGVVCPFCRAECCTKSLELYE